MWDADVVEKVVDRETERIARVLVEAVVGGLVVRVGSDAGVSVRARRKIIFLMILSSFSFLPSSFLLSFRRTMMVVVNPGSFSDFGVLLTQC